MKPNFYKTADWRNLRLLALRRDRFTCTVCGASLRGKGMSRVDHIVPVKKRPDLALRLDNLRCLCPSCDNKRHAEKGLGEDQAAVGLDGYPESWR